LKGQLNRSGQFGSLAVFMTSISTILGAILFLRFGYAVGHVGFAGVLGIILLGHAVTIPTALAVSEISTNRKVEGGGFYYVISRSFGMNIGAPIGMALYLSQAISIAFYLIAFTEAFYPFAESLAQTYSLGDYTDMVINKRFIGISAMSLLTILMLTKGANIGIKALYIVTIIIFISLLLFFLGHTTSISINDVSFINHIQESDNFFYVFTIIFPAFTGISAGIGLSGDLKNPARSIPRGTLIATAVGCVIYLIVAIKLVLSAPLSDLANNQMIMQDIALWGPIIPIGLACASISSALGSIMVAPRTLQALGKDDIFPSKRFDDWIGRGRRKDNEPINSSLITCLIAYFFIFIGDINFVAQIISMFFMVNYGAICLISFLEHFSGDPSYRPKFKSRWYISLFGALLSVWLMFKMNTYYATSSIVIMILFYYYISKSSSDKREIVTLFRDVLVQFARQLQILLQKKDQDSTNLHWRPFVVSISNAFSERTHAFEMTRWISHKYGFGTYIHYIKGYLSKQLVIESEHIKNKLIKGYPDSNVYIDSLISPSYTSALAQVVQLSSISGKKNNLILLEYCDDDKKSFEHVISNFNLLQSTGYDVAILRSNKQKEDKKEEIHIWISSRDYENSNMMILLGYMILGHPDWHNAKIKVFSIYPRNEFQKYKERMIRLMDSGRLPISPYNMKMIPQDSKISTKDIIKERSQNSDLTIIGFRSELVKKRKLEIFEGYNGLGNILFVNSIIGKDIE